MKEEFKGCKFVVYCGAVGIYCTTLKQAKEEYKKLNGGIIRRLK